MRGKRPNEGLKVWHEFAPGCKSYSPMRGFGNFTSASRFCRAFDEVRQFFRVRMTMKQCVSLVQQREGFRHRLDALKVMVLVA